MALKLYNNKVCPFGMRAWLTIEEKGIPYEYIHIPLGDDKPEWFTRDINPRGTVPALAIGTKIYPESLIVAELLEDSFPANGTPLLPRNDATLVADVRLFINDVGGLVGDLYKLLHAAESQRDSAAKEVSDDIAYLEGIYAKQSKEGPYFLGETLSLADISIVPFLDRFRYTLKEYQGYDLLVNAPRLTKLMEAMSQRESFKKTAQPADFYVEAYAKYAPKKESSSKI